MGRACTNKGASMQQNWVKVVYSTKYPRELVVEFFGADYSFNERWEYRDNEEDALMMFQHIRNWVREGLLPTK
jgi:hypothetical protein